jgi:hypothetical protein
VSGGTLVLAANEVGTASNPLATSVSNLTVNNGVAGGLFLSNNTSLAVTSGAIGGNVAISTTGDLTLENSMSGNNVALTATIGALTSKSGATLTATGALTLMAQQIGDSSLYSPDGPAHAATEVLQTDATIINAEATYGGIYISNDNAAPLLLTAGAVGPVSKGLPTSNIEVYSDGSIVIDPQTTPLSGPQAVGVFTSGTATLVAGETLSYNGTATTTGVASSTVTSNMTLPAGANPTYFDVEAGMLFIDGASVASSTDATGAGYGPLVVQTNLPASGVTGSQTSGPPLELTASELTAGGTFTASAIIIDNLGVNGQPGVLTIPDSLTLDATDGSVVFLNPNDTIVVTGPNNTITVYAGTISSANGTIGIANSAATSRDVTVLGNLATEGGNIIISAVGNVMIGTINAGSGQVELTSLSGSILSNNGTALAITGATILKSAPQSASGSQGASLIQLNATQASMAAAEAVAAYDAAVAEAGADLATATALQADLAFLYPQIVMDQQTYAMDVSKTNSDQDVANQEQSVVDDLNYTADSLNLASGILQVIGGGLSIVADALSAIPDNVGTQIASGVIAGIADGISVVGNAISVVVDALTIVAYQQGDILANDGATVAQDQAEQYSAQAQLEADINDQTAVAQAYNSVLLAYQNEEVVVAADKVIMTAAQTASAQATAALAGTAGPLPLTVAGPVSLSDPGSGASGAGIAVTTPITVAEPASGAEVAFTAVNGAITSVNPTPVNGGTGYADSSTFDLLVTGGGGSGGVVQATTNASGVIISFAATPLAGGSGYSNSIGAATGPNAVVATTGSGAELSFTAAGGVLTSVDSTPVAGGNGYPDSSTFDLAVTGAGGSGGVVQATTNASGAVTSFSLLEGGSGYTTTGATAGSPTGGGAQLAFVAVGGVITSVDSTPVDGGSGYADSSTFDLTVTGGSGGVVQATTNANGEVISFSLVSGGIGYNSTATTGLAGVTINTNSPLTVSANIAAPGAIELTAEDVNISAHTTIHSNSTITITGDASDNGHARVTIGGTLDAPSALIGMDAGSPGHDTFNISPSATTPITVTGVGADNTLNFDALGRAVILSETPSEDTITAAGMQPVMITNLAFVNITNAPGVSFASFAAGAPDFMLNSVALQVGGAWVDQLGSFTISGTTETAQSSTVLATINGISNAANEAVGLTINTLTTGKQVGLVARYNGSGLSNM